MHPDFWQARWRERNLGWHREDINPLVIEYWPSLELDMGSQVFLPLCGKTLDMGYLAGLGHRVLGCELSEIAAREFFKEANLAFEQHREGDFVRFAGDGISIFQGDLFSLEADALAGTVGVFDRGALVALPPDMREKYAAHLVSILPESARILLVTLDYDQTLAPGPPFSVGELEVRNAFGDAYRIDKLLEERIDDMPPRFVEAGCGTHASPVIQVVWKLVPR